MVVIGGSRISAKIFMTMINVWKLLAAVIKSSILDIGRVFGSAYVRELNTALDLKLKFIILSVT